LSANPHKDEIIRRRKAGERPTDIATALGVSRNVVLGILHRAKLTDSTSPKAFFVPRRRTEAAFREAVARAAGALSAVAEEWGVHETTVRIWRQEFGAAQPAIRRVTDADVPVIIERRKRGERLHVIAADYGVHLSYICKIAKGYRSVAA
jgi:hypothetical protein